MSDGTAYIRFLDPETFGIRPCDGQGRGVAIANLNELEFVKGEIVANVWKTIASRADLAEDRRGAPAGSTSRGCSTRATRSAPTC